MWRPRTASPLSRNAFRTSFSFFFSLSLSLTLSLQSFETNLFSGIHEYLVKIWRPACSFLGLDRCVSFQYEDGYLETGLHFPFSLSFFVFFFFPLSSSLSLSQEMTYFHLDLSHVTFFIDSLRRFKTPAQARSSSHHLPQTALLEGRTILKILKIAFH